MKIPIPYLSSSEAAHKNGKCYGCPSTKRNESSICQSLPSRQSIVQPKLELTTPGDSYEREADRMADFVMQKGGGNASAEMPSAASVVHPTISRSVSGSAGVVVDTATEGGINASRGGGLPMPEALRSQMESGFGADFSGVRLHTDSKAADLSRGIQAKAFTYGNDIFFNSGQYQPHSAAGQRLIAHELTHVVQQSGKVGREGEEDAEYENIKELLKTILLSKQGRNKKVAVEPMKVIKAIIDKIMEMFFDLLNCSLNQIRQGFDIEEIYKNIKTLLTKHITEILNTLPLSFYEELFDIVRGIDNWENLINLQVEEKFWNSFWSLMEKYMPNPPLYPKELEEMLQYLVGFIVETKNNNPTKEEILFDKFKFFITPILSFEYNKEGRYYYTALNKAIQYHAGFTNYIDKLGPLLGMDLDTKVAEFDVEINNKKRGFRLQFWKGFYGFRNAIGGEIGIYSNETLGGWSKAPEDKFQLHTIQQIFLNDTLIISHDTNIESPHNRGKDWWNLAIKTDSRYQNYKRKNIKQKIKIEGFFVNNDYKGNFGIAFTEALANSIKTGYYSSFNKKDNIDYNNKGESYITVCSVNDGSIEIMHY